MFHKNVLFFLIQFFKIRLSRCLPLRNLPCLLSLTVSYFFSNLTIPLFCLIRSHLHKYHPSVLFVSALPPTDTIYFRTHFFWLFCSSRLMCASCSAVWGPVNNLVWTCDNMTLAQWGSRSTLLIRFLFTSTCHGMHRQCLSIPLSLCQSGTGPLPDCALRYARLSTLV